MLNSMFFRAPRLAESALWFGNASYRGKRALKIGCRDFLKERLEYSLVVKTNEVLFLQVLGLRASQTVAPTGLFATIPLNVSGVLRCGDDCMKPPTVASQGTRPIEPSARISGHDRASLMVAVCDRTVSIVWNSLPCTNGYCVDYRVRKLMGQRYQYGSLSWHLLRRSTSKVARRSRQAVG